MRRVPPSIKTYYVGKLKNRRFPCRRGAGKGGGWHRLEALKQEGTCLKQEGTWLSRREAASWWPRRLVRVPRKHLNIHEIGFFRRVPPSIKAYYVGKLQNRRFPGRRGAQKGGRAAAGGRKSPPGNRTSAPGNPGQHRGTSVFGVQAPCKGAQGRPQFPHERAFCEGPPFF